MSEGDTIFRTATTLRAVLAGKALERFDAPRLRARPPAPGTTVPSIEARGKHLLIAFGDGRVLHTHMQMSGSWHVYRPGERWWKPRAAARVVLETANAVAVCFSASLVALLDQRVACEVGNVFKSETLFACRTDPFARVGDLDGSARRAFLRKASELLRRNLDGGPRMTYEGGLAVYDKTRRPCPACGTAIRSSRRGEGSRVTYWCPACQPPLAPEVAG